MLGDLRQADLDSLTGSELAAIEAREKWLVKARTTKRRGKQIPPDGDWRIMLILAGRGFGKTATLSEAMWWDCWRVPSIICNIVAPTISDVNGTNFEGPAGFRASVPAECLYRGSWEYAFVRQRRELRLANGSMIRGFGAQEEAARLRGPQCHILAGDELREWDRPAGNLELSINNALYGLRLPYPDGSPSRAIFATTKKPIPFLKRLSKQAGVLLVVGTSYENLENLSQTYREHLLAQQGTLLGRQEIENAWIDEESDLSIIKREWIRLWPARKKLPAFETIVAGVDAAATEDQFDKKSQQRDPTGVGIFGVFNVKQAFTEDELRKLRVKGRYAALLIDYWAERLGLPDLLERARKIQQSRWGTPGRKIDIWLIEQASSGPGMRQFMNKWSIPTWPSIPHGDKAMRLHNAAPLIMQGGLFVPESLREDRKGMVRDWVETPFLEELCAFAGEGSTEHDEACLMGGTGIYTARGLVAVEAVRPGDLVMTHAGRFRCVLGVSRRYSDHYYRLKAKGLAVIGITGNHPALVMRIAASQRKGKEARGVRWAEVQELKPRPQRNIKNGWKTASRVIHDGLVIPQIRELSVAQVDLGAYHDNLDGVVIEDDTICPVAGSRYPPSPRFIALDSEAGWCMGLFAAEGCVSGHQINWSCDVAAIERCMAWTAKVFGRSGCRTKTKHSRARTEVLSLGCVVAVPLFREFGYLAENKIVPDWALTAPLDFVRGFVDGFAHGDGHRTKKGMWALTSTSKSLLWGVKLMLGRLGIGAVLCDEKPGGQRLILGRMYDCLPAYRLDYSDNPRSWRAVIDGGYIATHIEQCDRIDEPVEVFNLSVEEDESYLTEGGLVHNCDITSSVFRYLHDRGLLDAKPDQPYIDREAEIAAKQEEAEREYEKQRIVTAGAWYS